MAGERQHQQAVLAENLGQAPAHYDDGGRLIGKGECQQAIPTAD
jgi:hypothetical protein